MSLCHEYDLGFILFWIDAHWISFIERVNRMIGIFMTLISQLCFRNMNPRETMFYDTSKSHMYFLCSNIRKT